MGGDIDTIARIRSWLMARKPELTEIGLDDDLIDTRVIDSLGFVEFVMFIEELVGCDIMITDSNVAALRTLRGIHDQVLTGLKNPRRSSSSRT
jgi:acyl carrier protein